MNASSSSAGIFLLSRAFILSLAIFPNGKITRNELMFKKQLSSVYSFVLKKRRGLLQLHVLQLFVLKLPVVPEHQSAVPK